MILKSKVTSKGQITIPGEIRNKLGIAKGDVLLMELDSDMSFKVKPAKKTWKEIAGLLHSPNQKSISAEEMLDVAAEAAIEKYKRTSK